LCDEDEIAKLKAYGITRREEDGMQSVWLALKITQGVLYPWFRVMPKVWTDLKGDRKDEDVTVQEIKDNDRLWATLYKRNGLELAMRLYAGNLRVIVKVHPRIGWEGQFTAFQSKLNEFSMADEEYVQTTTTRISNMRAQNKNDVLADQIERNPELGESAKEAAGNLIVVVDGKERTATVNELIRAKVYQLRGKARITGMLFLKNARSVEAAALDAERMGSVLEVISFGQ
jgi:hypothetical protein